MVSGCNYDFLVLLWSFAEIKNQWARDDPAFVVLLILFLFGATTAYCLTYGTFSIWMYLWALIRTCLDLHASSTGGLRADLRIRVCMCCCRHHRY
jgi:hypothetical protein